MPPRRANTVLLLCNVMIVTSGLLLVTSGLSAFFLITGVRAAGEAYARPIDVLTPLLSLAFSVTFLALALDVRRRVRNGLPRR